MRYSLKYEQPSVKHSLQIMILGMISVKGRAALSFLSPTTAMNRARYLSILKDKLPVHMRKDKRSLAYPVNV